MKNAILSAGFCIFLAGCTTLAPNFSTESCLSKVENLEIIQTAGAETLADLRSKISLENLDKGEKYLLASNEVLSSANTMCETDTRTALNLLSEAQSLIMKFNKFASEVRHES